MTVTVCEPEDFTLANLERVALHGETFRYAPQILARIATWHREFKEYATANKHRFLFHFDRVIEAWLLEHMPIWLQDLSVAVLVSPRDALVNRATRHGESCPRSFLAGNRRTRSLADICMVPFVA